MFKADFLWRDEWQSWCFHKFFWDLPPRPWELFIVLSTTWARRYFPIAHCTFLKLWVFFWLFNEDSLLESPHCSSPTNPKQSSWAEFGTTPHWLNHVSHNWKHYSHILDPIIPEKENQSRCSNVSFVGTIREASQASCYLPDFRFSREKSHSSVGNISSSSSEFIGNSLLLALGAEKGLRVQLSPNKPFPRYRFQPV